MSEIQHDELCLREQARQSKYIEKWPNYCKECYGNGYILYTYDPSPPGISLGSGWFTDIEPCFCLSNGICPRCYTESLPYDIIGEVYIGLCMKCGFHVNDVGYTLDGLPGVDCNCWMAYEPDFRASGPPKIEYVEQNLNDDEGWFGFGYHIGR